VSAHSAFYWTHLTQLASFRISKSDLQARPIYHRKRDSIEAHLTIVFAALAVSRWIEAQTGWSIRNSSRPPAATAPYRSRPDDRQSRPPVPYRRPTAGPRSHHPHRQGTHRPVRSLEHGVRLKCRADAQPSAGHEASQDVPADCCGQIGDGAVQDAGGLDDLLASGVQGDGEASRGRVPTASAMVMRSTW
jgi:hypothetical protein